MGGQQKGPGMLSVVRKCGHMCKAQTFPEPEIAPSHSSPLPCTHYLTLATRPAVVGVPHVRQVGVPGLVCRAVRQHHEVDAGGGVRAGVSVWDTKAK